jgi:nitroreductase
VIADLVARSRSYRRFHQERPVPPAVLRELIGLARLAPSAANRQPLRFVLSHTAESNARVFPHLAWAGYLPDWSGPAPGERPAAYIIILGDRRLSDPVRWDDAIAAQTILLGAAEKGLGGCIIGSVQRDALRRILGLPDRYAVLLVLALGEPAEEVVIEPVGTAGDIRYWRDAAGVHHVPKRDLDELILDVV